MGKHHSMSDLNISSFLNRPARGGSSTHGADATKSELSGLVFRIDEKTENGSQFTGSTEKNRLTKIRSASPIELHSPTAMKKAVTVYDVAIIGAGPAGLVLA
jgi:hypothetical protein